MSEFDSKVVLITGAGRGIGREIALAFASLGAVIAANDINPINVDETVSQILQLGGKARSYVFDVAKRMPIEAMVMQVLDHFGRIDCLINHAAVKPDAYLLDMDEWEFHRTLDVNLGGPFFTMQQVGRAMRQQGGGAMVNLLSTIDGERFQKGHAAHLASQTGVVGLTYAAAPELATYNIRINTICCGRLDSALVASLDWDNTAYHDWMEALPDVKLGEHPNLDRLALYLCSTASSVITGKVFAIEAGS